MAGTKRKAATEAQPTSSVSRRQSGRAKKVQVVYAESDAEDVQSDDEFKGDIKSESDAEVDEPEEDEDEDADDAEESEMEIKAKKGGLKGWKKTTTSNGREQMVIDIPGKKDAGDTPYEDGRIHGNTLEFLRELKRNNKREWLKFHDVQFRYVYLISYRTILWRLLTFSVQTSGEGFPIIRHRVRQASLQHRSYDSRIACQTYRVPNPSRYALHIRPDALQNILLSIMVASREKGTICALLLALATWRGELYG